MPIKQGFYWHRTFQGAMIWTSLKKVNFYLLATLIIITHYKVVAQTPCTFNVRTETSQLNTVFNSVVPFKNGYLTTGIARNKLPPFNIGTEIYSIDSSGSYELRAFAFNSERSLDAWARENTLSQDGNLYFTGYSNASDRELLIGKYNPFTDSLTTLTVRQSIQGEGWLTGIGIQEINDQVLVYGNATVNEENSLNNGIVFEVDSNLNTTPKLDIQLPPPSSLTVQDLLQLKNNDIALLYSQFQSNTYCEPHTTLHLRIYNESLAIILHEYSFDGTENISTLDPSIHESPDGSIYLHAQRLTYLNTNPRCNAAYYEDPRIFKFNDTLGLEWERDFTRPDDFEWESRIADIAPAQDGNFVTAYSQAIPVEGEELTFQKVLQLIKFTAEGELLWRRLYSAFGEGDTISVDNKIYDLKPTPDGGFVMVGESRREVTNFETDTTDAFRQRGWILKVDSEGRLRPSCLDTTVSNIEYQAAEMSGGILFPNPTNDLLNVQPRGRWGPNLRFLITDQLGRVIRTLRASLPFTDEVTYTVDVSNLRSGVYHLTVEDGQRKWSGRFVKQ